MISEARNQIHLQEICIFLEPVLVIEAFVTRIVGDNKFGFHPQPTHQFYGMFNPLALHDPSGLKNKELIIGNSNGLSHIRGVIIWKVAADFRNP